VLKLLALVIALIIAAMVAGAYLHFNPAIPIFVILGFGIYMVGRIGGPRLPDGSHAGFGYTYGIYLHREDFVPPDPDSHSGGHLRDGVDPNEPKAR
jgi:ABC-type branched-subunit amino acid transport system permease subunit